MKGNSTLSATDSTSNVNNGTVTNVSVETGQIDGAASFDGGVTDCIDMGDPANGSLDIGADVEFTVSAWIKLNNTTQDHKVIDKRNVAGYQLRYTATETGGVEKVFVRVDEGATLNDTATTADNAGVDGTWHYFVGGRDTSNNFLYLDGALNNTTADSTLADLSETASFFVGGNCIDDTMVGGVDEVRFSNTDRSSDWIATEYNNQVSPKGFHAVGGQEVSSITDPLLEIKGGVEFR